jgi:hypothetical protein
MAEPQYTKPYLEDLAGPDEQHAPEGGWSYEQMFDASGKDPEEQEWTPRFITDVDTGKQVLNPGGFAHAGLTVKQMGDIGEAVVMRLGELPGVGAIMPMPTGAYNQPLDCMVENPRGRFGCEIKANHSQAQPRFKIGGRDERLAKIEECYLNGLKPALIGVRLNFFTNLAYVFFREGLTDTWIGNDRMMHVGTFNFEDLNPFRSPDPKAQELAVENAHLPDQSMEDEFEGVFASIRQSYDENQPRDELGRFTFKHDVQELKVKDSKGKHTHNVRRCKHCGHLNAFPVDPAKKAEGRQECSTCGQDPDRDLRLAKIVLGTEEDDVAQEMGFDLLGRTAQGHRKYIWQDQNGTRHTIVTGSDRPSQKDHWPLAAQMMRQRMTRCLNGTCNHITTPALVEEAAPGDNFVARAGQTVTVDGQQKFISEIDGNLALIFDVKTGAEDIVPVQDLQKASVSSWEPRTADLIPGEDPDYLFVYYMSELHVEPYNGHRRFERMLEELLNRFGDTMDKIHGGPETTEVAAGEIFMQGNTLDEIKHLQLCTPEVRMQAEEAIDQWLDDRNDEWYGPDDGWITLDTPDQPHDDDDGLGFSVVILKP